MVNLKEHIKLTGVYTFFAAFPAILQLIVYPVIEGKDRLGAEDFGYLAITEAFISFFSILITFGSVIGVLRFYWDYNDDKSKLNRFIAATMNNVIARTLLILGVVILASYQIGSFFPGSPLQQFEKYGPFLVLAAMSRTVFGVTTILYRNEKNVRDFFIISLIYGLVRAAFQIIGVLYLDLSFIGYVYGTAIGGSIVSLVAFFMIYRRTGLHLKGIQPFSFLVFSVPLVINDLIFWTIIFIDRFFLLKNPEHLGIYDNAMKFAIGIQLIIQGLASAVQPEIFRYLKEGIDKSEEKIKSISNLFVMETIGVVAICIIPLMIFIHMFFETSLMISAGLLSVIMVRYIMIAQYDVFSWVIIYMKKTKIFLVINFAVLSLAVTINVFLVPVIGYYGSVTAFLTSTFLQVLLFWIAQQKILKIKWNYFKLLVFPFSIVFFAASAEFLKIYYGFNMYLNAISLVFFIFLGILILYKKEIFGLVDKIRKLFS